MEPTADRDRLVLLDILRGLAVFGMFTVNMSVDLPWGSAFREEPLGIADSTAMIAVDLLANGKFITIFSFLFGVGFFLQLERARAKGIPFLAAYFRRLLALFSIAAVAMIAGLGTHILIDYSIFGLLLLLFWKQRLWDAPLLGLMLLGGYVFRRGGVHDPAVCLSMASTAFPWLLSIGVAGMVSFVWLNHFADANSDLLTLMEELAFWPVGALLNELSKCDSLFGGGHRDAPR